MKRRQYLSHQVRPVEQWPLFDIQVTRYTVNNQDTFRLHIGFDALILDYWSMLVIFNELHQLYSDPDINFPELQFSFRGYLVL